MSLLSSEINSISLRLNFFLEKPSILRMSTIHTIILVFTLMYTDIYTSSYSNCDFNNDMALCSFNLFCLCNLSRAKF